jgi:hypothetical protein
MARGYDIMSTLNPQQASLLQQLLGGMQGQQGNVSQNPLFQSSGNYLQNLLQGGDEAFSKFEAPFQRQFQEQTIPGLAERFAGLGAGSQSSSAFQQALGQAGAGLSENLAALRSGLQMQAVPYAQQQSQQPFNNLLQLLGLNTQAFAPKQPSFLQSLGLNLAGGVGQGLGMFAGEGIGSGLGAAAKGIGGLFNNNPWQSSYGGLAQSRSGGTGITETRFPGR